MVGNTPHDSSPNAGGHERNLTPSPEGAADLLVTKEGIQLAEGFAAKLRGALRRDPRYAAMEKTLDDLDAPPVRLGIRVAPIRVKDLDGKVHVIPEITSMRIAAQIWGLFASDIQTNGKPTDLPDVGRAAANDDLSLSPSDAAPAQPSAPMPKKPSSTAAASASLQKLYASINNPAAKKEETMKTFVREPVSDDEERALRELVAIVAKQQTAGTRPGTWATVMSEKLGSANGGHPFADTFYANIGLKPGMALINFCRRVVDIKTDDAAGPDDLVAQARPLAQRIIDEYEAMMKQMQGDELGGGYGRAFELERVAVKFDSDKKHVRKAGLLEAPTVASHHLSMLRPRLTQEPDKVQAVATLLDRGMKLPEFDTLSRNERALYEAVATDARHYAHRARISDKGDRTVLSDPAVAARRGKIQG